MPASRSRCVRDGRPAAGYRPHRAAALHDRAARPGAAATACCSRWSTCRICGAAANCGRACETIWMGAGPVPEILHRAVESPARGWCGCGCCRRCRRSPPLMHRAINTLRWGEHRGGMFVAVEGATRGGRADRALLASARRRRRRPLIPSMAVEAIVRRCLDGQRAARRARGRRRGDLELADYEALFARRAIHTGVAGRRPRTPRCRSIGGCSASVGRAAGADARDARSRRRD